MRYPKFNYVFIFCATVAFFALLSVSCKRDKDDDPSPVNDEEIRRAVIIYAVNHSSLRSDFINDRKEMMRACGNIDLEKYSILLYQTDSETECSLNRFVKSRDGSVTTEVISTYPRSETSTSPARINEVLKEALGLYPRARYDLIFWGHGTSWVPDFDDHTLTDRVIDGMAYSYGGEYDGGKDSNNHLTTDSTDIDELARAVPSGVFDTIWFDCCYMSAIEVIYEFKDKCKTFVGYPTEVWNAGMAYDEVLPYLLREEPDVVGGARAFFDYYYKSRDEATVAVIDMDAIEPVAAAARDILSSCPERPALRTLLNYSRLASFPFVDMIDYLSITADFNGRSDLSDRVRKAGEEMVIFHAESDKNFNGNPWDTSKINGVSTHYFVDSDSRNARYYKGLKWYKRVYAK